MPFNPARIYRPVKNNLSYIIVYIIFGYLLWCNLSYLPSTLLLEMKTDKNDSAQVFYDRGDNFNESDSIWFDVVASKTYQTYQLTIPGGEILAIRIDPLMQEGTFAIKSIRIKNGLTDLLIEKEALQGALLAANQVELSYRDNIVYGLSNGDDPHIVIDGIEVPTRYPVAARLAILLALALVLLGLKKIVPRLKDSYSRNKTSISGIFKRRQTVLTVIVMISMIVIIYYDFLTLSKLYIYRDIGSDTYFQFWPTLQMLHNHISSGSLPLWSFNQGLGQNIFPSWLSNPFMWLPVILGGNGLVYALPYMQGLQIIVSGLFFYLYLRELAVSRYSALLGAFFYSFSGHIILRGGWYIYSSEVVVAAVVLYLFELYYNKKNWWLFPLAAALLAVVRGPYHFILYTMLLVAYATVRFVLDRGTVKTFLKYMVNIVFNWGLGLLIAAVFIMPGLISTLQSPRTENAFSKAQSISFQALFAINAPEITQTLFLRLFSSDLWGAGSNYSGWGNYFEAPLFYCGLICIILAPAILCIRTDKKTKTVYSAVFCAVLIYMLMPMPRTIMSAFEQINSFRHSSFWITIVLIIFSVKMIDYLLLGSAKSALPKYVAAFSLLLISGLLTMRYYYADLIVDLLFYSCLVLIIAYTASIFLINSKKMQQTGKIVLFALVIIELTVFSYYTVNNRETLDAGYLTSKAGYFDHSLEALDYINQRDDSGFFRIEKKDYNSVFFADSLFQNYYGVKSYHPFNNKYYLRFINEMGLPLWRPGLQHYIQGFGERFFLDTLVGVKYIFVKEQANAPYGYQHIHTIEDIHIYQNNHDLPLGFGYRSYIPYAQFKLLPPEAKDLVLLKSFVLEPQAEIPAELTAYSPAPVKRQTGGVDNNSLQHYYRDYSGRVRALNENKFVIEQFAQNRIEGSIYLEEPALLFFSIPYDRGWSITVNGEKMEPELVNLAFIGVYLEPGEHAITLKYRLPYLLSGLFVSIFAIIIYAIMIRKRGVKTDVRR